MNDLTTGSITIAGLSDLTQRLINFGDTVVNQVTKEALKSSARLMQDKAKSNVKDSDGPHLLKSKRAEYGVWLLPGNLRKGIKVKFDRTSGKGSVRYEVYVEKKHRWYWKFVEFGSVHNQPPRRYMRGAFETEKEYAVTLFKNALREAIEKGGRK